MGELSATDSAQLKCPECGTDFLLGVKYCANCGTSLSGFEADRSGEPLPAGTMIGSYRLIDVVGEGGMGRVYVAEHVKLGRRVAIKMLRAELAQNPVAVSRFFAEARAVNRISHEHIVEITDFLEAKGGGDNCYIMELLNGEDLGIRLLRDAVPPLARTLDILAQTASALAAVHAAGIVHRDLKPDNIFLIDRGGSPDFVKLLDFGVAKLTTTDPAIGMHTTGIGQIIGTPEYMSPEQAGGQPIDHRTDIYALGVILYQMVAGHLPFQAKSFGELLIKHMTVPVVIPPAPGLPPSIKTMRDGLLRDLLAKDADDRPESMEEVEHRLRDMLDGLDLPPPPRRSISGSGSKRASSQPPNKPSSRAPTDPPALGRVAIARRFTPTSTPTPTPTPTPGRTPTPSRPRIVERNRSVDRRFDSVDRRPDPPVVAKRDDTAARRELGTSPTLAPPVSTPDVSAPAVSAPVVVVQPPVIEAAVATPADLAAPPPTRPVVPETEETQPVRKQDRRRRVVVGAGVAGVCAVLGIVAIVAFRGGDGTTAALPATKTVTPAVLTPSPTPATITLRFASTPRATVRIVGSTETLGTTPFSKSFPYADRLTTFEFEAAGHISVIEEARLDRDGALAAALPALPIAQVTPKSTADVPPKKLAEAGKATPVLQQVKRTTSKTTKASGSAVDKNGTMDVFGGTK